MEEKDDDILNEKSIDALVSLTNMLQSCDEEGNIINISVQQIEKLDKLTKDMKSKKMRKKNQTLVEELSKKAKNIDKVLERLDELKQDDIEK